MIPSTFETNAAGADTMSNVRRLVEQALALLDQSPLDLDLSIAAHLQDSLDRIVAAGVMVELPQAA